MADYLTTALSGLGTTTNETPWGTVGQILLEQSPYLINKQRPSGGNLAAAFGTALLGGLIKYKGRQDAAEQTAEAASLAQQIQSAKTPEERLAIAQSAESGNVRNKLTGLVNALTTQDVANARELAQKKAGMQAELEMQLSPLAKELRQAKLADEISQIRELAAARKQYAETIPQKDFWETIPKSQQTSFTAASGQVNELRKLAAEFRDIGSYAPKLNLQKLEPGSKADRAFSKMNTLVPSTARLLGEVGNLAQEEQARLIRATLGGPTSGTESIAKRLEDLADTAESKITTSLEAYKTTSQYGGEGLLQQLKQGKVAATPGMTEAQKRNQELKQRLANLESLLAGQGR